MRKLLPFMFCLLLTQTLQAQFLDDFSDGDFTSNPTWIGDVSEFQISAANELQNNGPAASASQYLATANNQLENTIWEFWVKLDFSPSTANFVRIYLASDQSDLAGSLNGYYIRIGESGSSDGIDLYRQEGNESTKIIDGNVAVLSDLSDNQARIRVIRDVAGNWTMEADATGGTNYVAEGTVFDNTFTTSNFFGVACTHSASRNDLFFFDDFEVKSAPIALVSAEAISTSQVAVLFSEAVDPITAEVTSNYSLNNGLGNPSMAQVDGTNAALVHLTYAGITTSSYTLTVNNVTSLATSEAVANNSEASFSFTAPIAYKAVVINEIFADFNPQVGLPEAEFIELYNPSSTDINLLNATFTDGSSTATFPTRFLAANAHLIVCAASDTNLFKPFGDVVGLSNFPSLNNGGETLSLSDAFGDVIDEVSYETSWYNDAVKDDGGYSLELINPFDTCRVPSANWSASDDASGGTPGTQNSIFDATADTDAPTIAAVMTNTLNSITITFSERMDGASLETATYTITDGSSTIDITQVLVSADETVVTLTTATMTAGVLYELSISNASDCAGNALGTNNNEVGQGQSPSFLELRINEIMADPTPEVGLPNAEFLEIYNPTNLVLSLNGVQLEDGSGIITLPAVNIKPDSFLILTTTTNEAALDAFGNAIGVPSFPSLTNGGEQIRILAADNSVIDEVEYDDAWYNDAVKDDGGYTLELINPNDTCRLPAANWSASNDASGGTPGRVNSLFDDTPDTEAPSIVSVTTNALDTITIVFDEGMDRTNLLSANYSITDGSITIGVNELLISATADTLVLVTQTMTEGVIYTISIANATDCTGNALGTNSNEVGLGKVAAVKELRINEIMADPSPVVGLPEREFIEIFNPTSFALRLNGMKLADQSDTTNLPDYTLKSNSYLILTGTSGVTDFETFGAVVGVTSFPNLANAGEVLRLLAEDFSVIDEVTYSEGWYQDEVKEEGGYSLELISPADTCRLQEANWIASNDALGGTPGTQNTVFDNSIIQEEPTIIAVEVLQADSIFIQFDTRMDANSVLNATYQITDGSSNFAVQRVQLVSDNTAATLKLAALTIGQAYTLQITNALSCSQVALTNTTVDFAYGIAPSFHDIIITEILADPNPIVGLPDVEYIEIYNTTNQYISLDGVVLTDLVASASFPNLVIAPTSYLIVTNASRVVDFSQTNIIGLEGFPSLANGGEPLVLKSANDALIFEITYSSDWFRDATKAGGGFSLEMIDLNAPCLEEINWKGSDNLNGGSPGEENSVNGTVSDNLAPTLVRAYPISTTAVVLEFNEKLDSTSTQTANISFDNGITIASRSFILPNTKEILLELNESLAEEIAYTVSIIDLEDCSGNLMTTANTAIVHLPQAAEVGDLIINEVVPDAFSGGSRYVELYNNSDKYISLQDWQLGIENSLGTVGTSSGQRAVLQSEEWILAPNEYVVFTDEVIDIKNDYPSGRHERVLEVATSSFLTLDVTDEDKRKLVLIDPNGDEMDRVELVEEMYFGLIDDINGVALERISFTDPTNDPNNWASAAENVGWGTPGYLNSQNIDNPKGNLGNDCFEITPEVFSPDNDGFDDVLTIHYTCNQNNLVASITIYDSNGREIKRLIQSQLLSTSGFINWDGVGDNGEKARMGYYIAFIETFGLNGEVKRMKKAFAVGGRF
ncbi:MAG: lamin tail domain-containing protein [Flammeovirgaceae bacterium]